MQSRAKTHHVAVLTWKFVTFNLTNVSMRCSSILVNQIRKLDSRKQQICHVTSVGCNRSPDAKTSGLWELMHPDDDGTCCSLFIIQQQSSCFWFRDSRIPDGTWEMQTVTRNTAWILLAWVLGLQNLMHATSLPMPRHLGNAIGRPMPGLGLPDL